MVSHSWWYASNKRSKNPNIMNSISKKHFKRSIRSSWIIPRTREIPQCLQFPMCEFLVAPASWSQLDSSLQLLNTSAQEKWTVMRRITGCSHSKSNSVSMWNATFDSWQIIWWANDGGAAVAALVAAAVAQYAVARRNWARTYVAGKSRGRWSFMRHWRRAEVPPCSGARCGGDSVAAPAAPSILSGGQGAVQAAATKWRHHYACANWCGPARSRGGACRAIIANSSSAAALRRKPLLTRQCCSSIVLLFLASGNEA